MDTANRDTGSDTATGAGRRGRSVDDVRDDERGPDNDRGVDW